MQRKTLETDRGNGSLCDSGRHSDTVSRSSPAPLLGGRGTGRSGQSSHAAVLRGQSRSQPRQQSVTDSHPCPRQESGFDRVHLVSNSPTCGGFVFPPGSEAGTARCSDDGHVSPSLVCVCSVRALIQFFTSSKFPCDVSECISYFCSARSDT